MVFLTLARGGGGGPFLIYVQDEVNRAQGFALNYQQLVKKKTSSTHVSLPSNDFCKDFLKETHSEVVREPIPTRR